MTQLARAMTPQMVAAALRGELYGTDKWIACVEAEFGSTVADDGNGKPDTRVTWDGSGLVVETSIDGGRSFRRVEKNGAILPGLEIGSNTTGKAVSARVFFVKPNAIFRSLRVQVTLENGDSFDETIAASSFDGTRAVSLRLESGAVRPSFEIGAEFFGTAHLVRERTASHVTGEPTETNVSRGIGRILNNKWIEIQDDAETDPTNPRFAKAAMAFDAWVYLPDEPAEDRYLFDYTTSFSQAQGDTDPRDRRATSLYIDNQGRPNFVFHPRLTPSVIRTQRLVGPAIQWAQRWVHVTVAFDGLHGSFFVNGSRRATSLLVGTRPTGAVLPETIGFVPPTDGHFFLGNSNSLGDPLRGIMAEARLWSLGLGAEVQRLNRHRLNAARAAELADSRGLAGIWPLRGEAFGVAPDLGPQALHLSSRNGVKFHPPTPEASFLGRTPPRGGLSPGDPAQRVPYWTFDVVDITSDANRLRLASGTSDVTFADGRTFTAAGDLLGIEGQLKEDGEVDPNHGLQFSLTGLDPQLRSIAMQATYQQRRIRLYVVAFNHRDQIIPTPLEVWTGAMDRMEPSIRTVDRDGVKTPILTIALSAEGELRDFDRPAAYRWNPTSHKVIYPQDDGFEYVAELTDREVLWPAQRDLDDSGAP